MVTNFNCDENCLFQVFLGERKEKIKLLKTI